MMRHLMAWAQRIAERSDVGPLPIRPALHLAPVLTTIDVACVYIFRRDGIFVCPARGCAPDRHLAYCEATAYADYEHGGSWFNLKGAAAAQHCFRLQPAQIAFSTAAAAGWLAAAAVRFYIPGLGSAKKSSLLSLFCMKSARTPRYTNGTRQPRGQLS